MGTTQRQVNQPIQTGQSETKKAVSAKEAMAVVAARLGLTIGAFGGGDSARFVPKGHHKKRKRKNRLQSQARRIMRRCA